jgi:hypothetical protein
MRLRSRRDGRNGKRRVTYHWLLRIQKVQAENVSVVAHPLRRTAFAPVGTTGWCCLRTCARSCCGPIAAASLQTTIALC